MRRFAMLLGTVFVLANAAAAATQPCPIAYSRLEMPYKHEKGFSTPTVELDFTNTAGKKIVRAKFALAVTGPQGDAVPYDQDLTFSAGADPGRPATARWELDMGKVDIQRLGEAIYLKSVRFADNTGWEDDGNQRCRYEQYYGPK